MSQAGAGLCHPLLPVCSICILYFYIETLIINFQCSKDCKKVVFSSLWTQVFHNDLMEPVLNTTRHMVDMLSALIKHTEMNATKICLKTLEA